MLFRRKVSSQGGHLDSVPEPKIEDFLGDPTREIEHWRWLWEGDHRFPVRSHRGVRGQILVFLKKILGPLVKFPLGDLFERQKVFNLILLEKQQGNEARLKGMAAQIDELRVDVNTLIPLLQRVAHLEAFMEQGLEEVMQHNDALFARVDQKLDRHGRESVDLRARLGSALAVAETERLGALVKLREEWDYRDLENRFRGTEEEIGRRLQPYLAKLKPGGRVLDLGCGRGESLLLLREAGFEPLGLDVSEEMVQVCGEKGLQAEVGDLFEYLGQAEPGSFDAVVSFHVIEHLPVERLSLLVRLAFRALRADGVLIFETPNPLSLLVSARSFWLDPTHLRPVHPDYLVLAARQAGFDAVERLDLRPYPKSERLPEASLEGATEEQVEVLDQVNRLRDRVDDLLFGFQDFAIIARK